MIRSAISSGALALFLITGLRSQPQGGQLDASPAIFSVMAAINAAGFDAAVDSPANSPLRGMVREALAAKKIDCLDDLKHFFAQHRKRDWNAEMNQYISYALTIDGPPTFHSRVPQAEIPPDAAELGGLEFILPRFSREANLEELWRKAQPYYERAIADYHGPVSHALLEATAYLRNPTSGYLGRRFQIYIDLLGAPDQVQSRSYKDDYFVVVTPSRELRTDQIRHAYLHYLLDPLALKFSAALMRKRGVADYAQGAPALDQAYKDDYILLATECFIKAVESRLAPASKRQAMVDEALAEGYTMTPAFAEQLAVFEKQPVAMRLYFPDLVDAIDLGKEEKRLENVHFASARAMRPEAPERAAPPPLSAAEKSIDAAVGLSARHDAPPADLEKAKGLFLRSLEQTSNSTLHAKAYYGLARIAALQRDPALSERLFEKVLELTPDAETKAWTYIYLGRLVEAAGDPERRADAEKSYRAALAVASAPEAAKIAAAKALERLSNPRN